MTGLPLSLAGYVDLPAHQGSGGFDHAAVGVIDVFDTDAMQSLGRVETEKAAHTTALAASGDHVFAFLPQSHRAAIYRLADGRM